MNNTYKSILSIVRNYLVGDNKVLVTSNFDELIDMSNKLAISPIVSFVLKNEGHNELEAPLLISFRNYKLQEMLKNEINQLFNTNNINFMYIKGSSVSKYYKDPYLRIGSDIDIVVEPNKYKIAKNLLLTAGYKLEMNVDSECHLLSPSGIMIDLHNCFIKTSNLLNDYLTSKFNSSHELSIEDTYLLLIAHSSKHFVRGVIDLKIFTDLFYIRRSIENYSQINEILKKLNLLDYRDTLNNYLDYLLGKHELDNTLSILEDFIIERNGNDVFSNHIIGKIAKDGVSKDNKKITLLSYIKSRIFIPKERMYIQFPNSKKHKVLLPLYYVYRPFYMLIRSGFRFKKIKAELSFVENIDNDKLNKYINLYKEIGLYNHVDK